ncbi:MAG: acyltransferase family protein [Kangiellaceae bacterium]|nr:acyltransferase family protein [Kangiellaceae bacterium]
MSRLESILKFFEPDKTQLPERRHDLDWLRVLAFGLLIFYHIGMLYVENWGFHIKSQYLSSQLESVMLLVNPWRMPILWMISGIAIRFVLARVTLLHFIKWRSYRLLLPLLFGVLVVVPPQLYYEMRFNEGLDLSYWEFYCAFWQWDNPIFDNYQPGIWPHFDVNHLWYLRELWTYSLYLIVLLPIFNSRMIGSLTDCLAERPLLLSILLSLPILVIQFSLEETRNAFGLLFLCYGYLLGWHPKLWKKLRQQSFRLLFCGVVCYLCLVYFYNVYWVVQSEETNPLILILGRLIHSIDRLVWVLAILGLAFRLLNHQSDPLRYLNEAVYPFYILHQTVIIVIAAQLSSLHLRPVLEVVFVIISTVLICFACYALIKRVSLLRPLFGLKLISSSGWLNHRIVVVLVSLIVLLFGLEILF